MIMGSGGMIVMDDTLLHGQCGQLLHGLLPRGVLRQVRSVSGRHHPAPHPARPDLPWRGDPGRPGPAGAAVGHGPATPACAASARAPPTRSSAPCATSATSTSPTSRTGPARPGSARSPTAGGARMSVHTLRIDGADVAGTDGQSILEVADRERHRHPDHVPPGRPSATSAPAGCASSRSAPPASCCRPARPRSRRAWRSPTTLRAAGRRTAGRSSRCCSSSATTSARCASPTTTASSRTWPRTCGLDPLRAAGRSTRGSASTPATRCSPSTTTAASCAPAACGSATRSRAPTPGTSWAGASTRGW